jgi:hypothetical protein
MKNWKQRTFGSGVFFGLVAIIALCFGFVGCDDKTPDPDPVEQSIEVPDTQDGVKIIVKYTALPGTLPSSTWWDPLLSNLALVKDLFTRGELVLTVVPGSTDGFAAVRGTKTATVGETFLVTNATDEEAILLSLNGIFGAWNAVIAN